MSHFLDRLSFFRKTVDTFADGHAEHWKWLASKKGLRLGQKTRSEDDLQDLRKLQQHIKGAGGN